ncbi:MAG: SDR family oxidoreductase [Geminicoccaceae bacterium]
MKTMLFFGLGYSAQVLADRLLAAGWKVIGTSRQANLRQRWAARGATMLPFDETTALPTDIIGSASHILTSIRPDAEGDLVLLRHLTDLRASKRLSWAGYLGTTAVYGDRDGAWVDESASLAPTSERGQYRVEAERAWLESGLPAHIFRLAGIYGPGRSAIDALRAGKARRIVKEGQLFSRIHVEDIANVLEASIERPAPGTIYNVCDDEPAPPQDVIAHGAHLLGVPVPPDIPFETAELSPMARSFYADNRRIRNDRIRRDLGVSLAYPTYREGLASLI